MRLEIAWTIPLPSGTLIRAAFYENTIAGKVCGESPGEIYGGGEVKLWRTGRQIHLPGGI